MASSGAYVSSQILPNLNIVALNGHSPDTTERVTPPRGLRGGKTRGGRIEPGRQIDPTGNQLGLGGYDQGNIFGNRRPFGREDHTLAALRTIRDLDPQVSQAVWTFLRLINPGHDLRAYVFKDPKNVDPPAVGETDTGDEVKENGKAQAYLDDLARRIGGEYGGGSDQLHNVLALSLITYGAVAAEVVPTDDLNDIVDWYPVDPSLITFRRDKDTQRLVMGQKFRDGSFKALNPEQVFYIPLDPDVNDPYGRPPLLPALNTVMHKASLLNDIRAVAHAQGFPRLDISVKIEPLIAAMPPSLQDETKGRERKEWMEGVLDSVVGSYNNLEVDDVFVHYDWVDINIIGPVHSSSGFDFKGIEAVLTRQLNSALKTLPILLGINEATSETHGSIQWQIQIKGVQALQRLIKRTIERLANVSLQIAGHQAHAKIEYSEVRTTDKLFEAQADFFEARIMQLEEQMGWRSHDEAAERRTGHAAAGPALLLATTPAPNLGTNQGGDTSGKTGDKAPAPAQPKTTDKPKTKTSAFSDGAWELIGEKETEDPDSPTFFRATSGSWHTTLVRPEEAKRQTYQNPDRNNTERVLEYFVEQAGRIYAAAERDLLAQLALEGWDLEGGSLARVVLSDRRDVAKDIADYVFGIGFSREMKALLRDAFRQGRRLAGTDGSGTVDEQTINRIWRDNRKFITKIRDELKVSLERGDFSTLVDVHDWFSAREWRELLMGRFLAKQGVEAGYAFAVEEMSEETMMFVWETSGSGDHCQDCLSREGHSYSYLELTSIGFPGSGQVDCGANCKCALVPEDV